MTAACAASARKRASSTADEHSPKSDQGVGGGPEQPPDTRHWILHSRHNEGLSKRLLLLASLVPIGVIFALSIVTGVTLNCIYTGSASGSSAPFVQAGGLDAGSGLSFPQSTIGFDALRSACSCAAVTTGLALVRLGVRNFTHPRC